MAGRKFQVNTDATITLPSGCVDAEACSQVSGKEIPLLAQRNLIRKEMKFGVGIGTTPVTTTEMVTRAKAAGNLRNFTAMLNVSGSSASMTFDLKKNGTTVLSAPITITNATGNQTSVSGSFSGSVAYVAGDIFTAVLTVSTSTGAQGPYADVEFDETAS